MSEAERQQGAAWLGGVLDGAEAYALARLWPPVAAAICCAGRQAACPNPRGLGFCAYDADTSLSSLGLPALRPGGAERCH